LRGLFGRFASGPKPSRKEQQAYCKCNIQVLTVARLQTEESKIPYRTVGPRRRVLVEDLLAYKAHEEAERHRGLDELVAEGQKLGMY
jgi:hypothetical protein